VNLGTDFTVFGQNSQSGTAYTVVLSDVGRYVECNNGSAITLTIPASTLVAWPVGAEIHGYQQGAGQITVAAGAGVTLRAEGGKVKSNGQYSVFHLRMRATDEWVMFGDTAA
jgi:hypothetical protein